MSAASLSPFFPPEVLRPRKHVFYQWHLLCPSDNWAGSRCSWDRHSTASSASALYSWQFKEEKRRRPLNQRAMRCPRNSPADWSKRARSGEQSACARTGTACAYKSSSQRDGGKVTEETSPILRILSEIRAWRCFSILVNGSNVPWLRSNKPIQVTSELKIIWFLKCACAPTICFLQTLF